MTESRAREVHEGIRQVLLHDWDPIGVPPAPQAQDEYDSYVGAVYRLLAAGASEREMAAHLREIEVEWMGLSRCEPTILLPVVRKLMALNVGLDRGPAA
ncbi:MAG: hypothetical protein ABI661_06755 [Gammaproteobacteria bacterium]